MNICVFSSSSDAISSIYFEEARELGRLIGKEGFALVNGGANVGLMEAVTVEASNTGARTIGVIPEKFIEKDLASNSSSQLISTKNMRERKAKMREIADAFIALPGGVGTLEEILEVITLKQLAYHNKPVVFINTNEFFKDLFAQFEKSFDENFIKKSFNELFCIANSSEEAVEYIKNYKPKQLKPKWYQVHR